MNLIPTLVTVRKHSLRRLCFYRCLSVYRGEESASVPAGRPPSCHGDPTCQVDPPLPGGPLPGRPPCQGDPHPPARGPTPKGEIEGIRSRSTPKGEIQGDQVQANIQVENSGGSEPDPSPTTTAAGSTHPTGMHSCCFIHLLSFTWRKRKENELK